MNPIRRRLSAARVAHDSLREDLEADANLGPRMLNSFLSGSYGRSTSIKGIKDVDIIIPLDYTFAELSEFCKAGESAQYCLLRLVREAIERSGRHVKSSTIRRRSILVKPKPIEDVNGIVDDEPRRPTFRYCSCNSSD